MGEAGERGGGNYLCPQKNIPDLIGMHGVLQDGWLGWEGAGGEEGGEHYLISQQESTPDLIDRHGNLQGGGLGEAIYAPRDP